MKNLIVSAIFAAAISLPAFADPQYPTLTDAQIQKAVDATGSCMLRQIVVFDDNSLPENQEAAIIVTFCFNQYMVRAATCSDKCWSVISQNAIEYTEESIFHWRGLNRLTPTY